MPEATETQAEFIFALTNSGSEKALKLEAESMALGWRPGYQRRGFVTFKLDFPLAADPLLAELAMARRLCRSLGKFFSRDEALQRILDEPGNQEPPLIHDARFENRQMRGIPAESRPRHGQQVGTIVGLGENEFWAGIHRHVEFLMSPDPAGDGCLEMPERSPSRAWLKVEEARRFLGLDFPKAGQAVVELGASPGGVVLALLDRGIPVIGVDPAKMAEVVMERALVNRWDAPATGPWFYHCRKPASLVSKRELGAGVGFFMSDMNQSAEVVLKELARFCKMAPSINGALLTLKLTALEQIAEKETWFAALREMGFKKIRLQQFAVHHRELALLALR